MNPLSSGTLCASARAVSERILNPVERGMLPVLLGDPAAEPTGAIGARRGAWKPAPPAPSAGVAEQVRANLALLEWRKVDAVDAPRRAAGKGWSCASTAAACGRPHSRSPTYRRHRIRPRGSCLRLVESVEVRPAVHTQQHGLAIDHEGRVPVSQRGLSNEQPHALAVALDDQAVAVVLAFVQPLRPTRNFSSAGRNAGVERGFGHEGKLGNRQAHARSDRVITPKCMASIRL